MQTEIKVFNATFPIEIKNHGEDEYCGTYTIIAIGKTEKKVLDKLKEKIETKFDCKNFKDDLINREQYLLSLEKVNMSIAPASYSRIKSVIAKGSPDSAIMYKKKCEDVGLPVNGFGDINNV